MPSTAAQFEPAQVATERRCNHYGIRIEPKLFEWQSFFDSDLAARSQQDMGTQETGTLTGSSVA